MVQHIGMQNDYITTTQTRTSNTCMSNTYISTAWDMRSPNVGGTAGMWKWDVECYLVALLRCCGVLCCLCCLRALCVACVAVIVSVACCACVASLLCCCCCCVVLCAVCCVLCAVCFAVVVAVLCVAAVLVVTLVSILYLLLDEHCADCRHAERRTIGGVHGSSTNHLLSPPCIGLTGDPRHTHHTHHTCRVVPPCRPTSTHARLACSHTADTLLCACFCCVAARRECVCGGNDTNRSEGCTAVPA